MEEKKSSRREFMKKYAGVTFIGAMGIWATSMARFTMPSLLPQETKKIKIGSQSDFPAGTVKTFDEEKVILFADNEGISAISLICTHLGCIVSFNGRGFECPCHGSKFGITGNVTRGPAPRGLHWYKIEQLPSGQLQINLSAQVKPGTKEIFYA